MVSIDVVAIISWCGIINWKRNLIHCNIAGNTTLPTTEQTIKTKHTFRGRMGIIGIIVVFNWRCDISSN